MYRILIVSEDFVLRKAVAFSLNDLDACVECADTVSAMLVLHRESPFDLVIVMGTAAEMCRQEVMDTLRADKTRRTRVFVISWPQSEQMVRSMYRMGVNQYMTLPVSLHRLRRKVINELIDRENGNDVLVVHRGRFGFRSCFGRKLVRATVCRSFCLRRDAERREKYLNSVLWMLFSGTEECAHCPEAMSSRDRRLIAEDIADLVDSTYGLDPAPLRRMSSVRGLMFSCCVVFAAMEVTAGLITCICFPECPSMKKQFGQWNVIRIAGTVMSASVR